MATFNSYNSNTANGNNKGMVTVINSIKVRLGKATRVALLLAAMILAVATPATAQVRFGVRGGVTASDVKKTANLLDTRHHTAYNAGVMLDMNIPKVNLGLEVSAMYRFQNNVKHEGGVEFYKRHHIDIPVYARYRLAIPGVERVVAPVVFTGPNVSLLLKDNKDLDCDEKTVRMSWDIGAGVDLFKHLRVTASYGIGMRKAMEVVGKDYEGQPVQGKDYSWNVSAAFIF